MSDENELLDKQGTEGNVPEEVSSGAESTPYMSEASKHLEVLESTLRSILEVDATLYIDKHRLKVKHLSDKRLGVEITVDGELIASISSASVCWVSDNWQELVFPDHSSSIGKVVDAVSTIVSWNILESVSVDIDNNDVQIRYSEGGFLPLFRSRLEDFDLNNFKKELKDVVKISYDDKRNELVRELNDCYSELDINKRSLSKCKDEADGYLGAVTALEVKISELEGKLSVDNIKTS